MEFWVWLEENLGEGRSAEVTNLGALVFLFPEGGSVNETELTQRGGFTEGKWCSGGGDDANGLSLPFLLSSRCWRRRPPAVRRSHN